MATPPCFQCRTSTTATAVTPLSATALDMGMNVISWLKMVQDSAISASHECLDQIAALHTVAPLRNSVPAPIQAVIDTVAVVASSHKYDPSLAPKASIACRQILYPTAAAS